MNEDVYDCEFQETCEQGQPLRNCELDPCRCKIHEDHIREINRKWQQELNFDEDWD